MNLQKNALVVIKVGSGLVMTLGFIDHLCRQIVILKEIGCRVVLVTSGAVAHDQVEQRSKNLRSAIGQGRLMSKYISIFDSFQLEAAQLLLTKHDFDEPETLVETLGDALADRRVVPILNANDVVDSAELKALGKYADNDRLYAEVIKLLKADFGLIGIDLEGLLDDRQRLVRQVSVSQENQVLGWARGGSHYGHGFEGMKTKLEVCFELARLGVRCSLVPAFAPAGFVDVFHHLYFNQVPTLGTTFVND